MKVFFIKRIHATIYCFILLVIVIAMLFSKKDLAVFKKGESYLIPIKSVSTDDKLISLSFNAIWSDEDLTNLVNVLSKYKSPATFFLTGKWIDRYPEAAKLLADRSFELMNLTNTYTYLTRLTQEAIESEIKEAEDKITRISQKKPNILRLPYDDYNDKVMDLLNNMGYKAVAWTQDSEDWQETSSPADISKKISNNIINGSILLFNVGSSNTSKALPQILEYLLKNEYKIVSLSELLLKENYIIDKNGVMVNKQ